MIRIAEFQDPRDALNFARLKGEDHAVCAGINLPYAVRPKSAQEEYADHPCVHDAREEAARERYELDYDRISSSRSF